jgi:hypothetical protein
MFEGKLRILIQRQAGGNQMPADPLGQGLRQASQARTHPPIEVFSGDLIGKDRFTGPKPGVVVDPLRRSW